MRGSTVEHATRTKCRRPLLLLVATLHIRVVAVNQFLGMPKNAINSVFPRTSVTGFLTRAANDTKSIRHHVIILLSVSMIFNFSNYLFRSNLLLCNPSHFSQKWTIGLGSGGSPETSLGAARPLKMNMLKSSPKFTKWQFNCQPEVLLIWTQWF